VYHDYDGKARMDLLCGFLDPKTIWSDLMLFAAYFDGSGKLHDPNSGYVVLAGVVLDLEAVPVFTSAWAECLRLIPRRPRGPLLSTCNKGGPAMPRRIQELAIAPG